MMAFFHIRKPQLTAFCKIAVTVFQTLNDYWFLFQMSLFENIRLNSAEKTH